LVSRLPGLLGLLPLLPGFHLPLLVLISGLHIDERLKALLRRLPDLLGLRRELGDGEAIVDLNR
jgi:hypothetical protein